ncbi:MAG: glycosyl hydrolase [Chitinophagaceae bacterium]|nr:MAG: glycosyl hydrolase [Chitinophagaceae bacterium]
MTKLLKFTAVFTQLLFSYVVFAQVKPTAAEERMKSVEKRKELEKKSVLNEISFRNIGPTTMSGRVADIEANPDDPTEFYVAYASGGLWYTKNNGLSFKPVFDSEDILTIGDIAVNWKTKTIWIGTGEVNSSRSSYAGIGVYKSSNNGKSWEYLGLPESHHIGKILLHPTDDNTAWVATLGHLYSPNKDRGVYKTTDGGKTWKQTLYVDDNTGAVEMDINPQNPNELYAATWYRTRSAWNFEEGGKTSGIYKSTDGGNTWKLVTAEGSGFPAGDGLGRIGLAVYPKNPQIVYAILDNQNPKPDTAKRDTTTFRLGDLKNLTKEQFAQLDSKKLDTFLLRNRMAPRYNANLLKEWIAAGKYKPTVLYDYLNVNTGFEATPIGCEVYRSDNGGQNWKKVNEKEVPIFFTYGYYFSKIYISPYNENKLYALGYSSQVSTDGGKTWKNMDKNNVHADHHALWVNPKKDSHLINGNDGGCYITYDDGEVWFKANTPAVGQFYAITTDNAKPYNVYGGLQDNGVWSVPSQTGRNSFSGSGLGLTSGTEVNIGGGDGMQVQVDNRDNATVYYGSQFGSYLRTNRLTREGTKRITPRHELGEIPFRFNWQSPILLSPHSSEILYFGSNYFHRSMNRGDTMIKLSADMTNGKKEGNVPYGTITTISESPIRFGLIYTGTDDGNIHISKDDGYSWKQLNQTAPQTTTKKSFKSKTPDYRLSTQNLWVSRVLASQHKESRVYVTLNGYRSDNFTPYLYVSEDYGNTWKQLGNDLPNEPINVVREDPKNDSIIYVGTDGGLYVSFDAGNSFMMWNAGLPKSVPVHDIAIQQRENEIVLGTHGRSLYINKLDDVQGLKKDRDWMKKKPKPKPTETKSPTDDDDENAIKEKD